MLFCTVTDGVYPCCVQWKGNYCMGIRFETNKDIALLTLASYHDTFLDKGADVFIEAIEYDIKDFGDLVFFPKIVL